ncbi:MAG: rhamnulokinase [Clostridia bacterium]|nr:rhamnulokinase [Clostridia bacterium]
MKVKYCLAIDIGASGGRHILGYIEDGRFKLEEIYRFENNLIKQNGSLIWDIDNLVHQVKAGIKKCGELGKIPTTIAIDTWGVDYVLLDKDLCEIKPVYAYRDSRTSSVIDEVHSIVSAERLYSKTGIQFQPFNSLYQLYCDKKSGRLSGAEHFLMIPEYLSFKLTGVVKNEYTNATTSGMVNALSKQWDSEILTALDLPQHLFSELCLPGSELGDFSDSVKQEMGFNAKVVLCPSHDTASAVAACPLSESSVYISSGTWSLIGTENTQPILTDASRVANFTNEGGINHRFRYLKNYMGMWLFQNIRKNINKSLTYDEMMQLAENEQEYSYIDVNAKEFVAPENMIEAIKTYLNKPDMTLAQVLLSVYHSLARSYKAAIDEIECLTGKTIDTVSIVGGGCQDKYLNRLTAEYTSKKVLTGPIEATATGNIISQLIYLNEITDLQKARQLIKESLI